jgi:hypothetical protein
MRMIIVGLYVQTATFMRVFENKVLKRILGPNRNLISSGRWRKLQNEDLHNLYSSSNTVKLIKLRKMRRMGHIVHKRSRK